MPSREVAWRVFAGEYNQANLQVTEGGERAPSFVVTPLGARVNRLLVVGVLTSLENVGKDGDMWKARVSDPTGQFTIYAGQYQPEAAKALAELRPPALVAVVGKSRAYSPEPGVTLVSVRPERVVPVRREERDHWSLETSKQTRQRLQWVSAALEMDGPTPEALGALGCPRDVAEGILQALQHYGKPDLVAYRNMLRDALEAVATGRVPDRPPSLPPPSRAPAREAAPPEDGGAATAGPGAPAAAAAGAASDAKLQHEERVVALVRALDDGKGAPWEGLVAEASRQGLGEADVEEAINSLLDKGLIYEPVLGRLRPT
jgi:uncharacterized protein